MRQKSPASHFRSTSEPNWTEAERRRSDKTRKFLTRRRSDARSGAVTCLVTLLIQQIWMKRVLKHLEFNKMRHENKALNVAKNGVRFLSLIGLKSWILTLNLKTMEGHREDVSVLSANSKYKYWTWRVVKNYIFMFSNVGSGKAQYQCPLPVVSTAATSSLTRCHSFPQLQ